MNGGEGIGGIVLCGGRSTRMGRPKEWLPIDGEFLLQRVVRVVSQTVTPVVVAARRGQELPALPADVAIVRDGVEDFGPLAGIAAGMEALIQYESLYPPPNPSPLEGEALHGGAALGHATPAEAALVVSCDHPFLRKEIIEKLIDALGHHRAVVVRDGAQVYPLLGVYRIETCGVLGEMIARGEHRARRFAEECGAEIISSEALREIDPQLFCLGNVNKPESYARALADELPVAPVTQRPPLVPPYQGGRR